MNIGGAWKKLGISPTSDQGVIRKAYATKLREMDVDADPDAFADLRQARDVALEWAKNPPVDATDEGPDRLIPARYAFGGQLSPTTLPADSGIAPAVTTRSVGQGFAPLPEKLAEDCRAAAVEVAGIMRDRVPFWVPHVVRSGRSASVHTRVSGFEPGVSDHSGQLFNLLMVADVEIPLEQEESQQALICIEKLLQESSASDLARQAVIENWLGEILARSWPRSDALLPMAAAYFNWEEQSGRIGIHPAIAYITDRLAARRFEREVQSAKHPLHGAWKELCKPARMGQRRGWVSGYKAEKIRELLTKVRHDYPELEARFDWCRVAAWENPPSVEKVRIFGWVFFGVLALQILAFIGRSVEGGPATESPAYTQGVVMPEPVPGGLNDEEQDIALALEAAGGPALGVDMVKQANLELYNVLQANWRYGVEHKHTQARYVSDMGALLRQRSAMIARQLEGSDLLALQKLRLAEARVVAGKGWDNCVGLLKQNQLVDPAHLPETLVLRQRQLVAALVTHGLDRNDQISGGESVRIPGHVVEATIRESGLPLRTVETVFRGKGSPGHMCRVGTALLHAILDLPPKERQALLKVI